MRLGFAFLILVALGSTAHAQLSTGAEISFDEFRIEVDDEFVIPTTEEDQRFYLNLATCQCSQAGETGTSIVYNLGITVANGPVTPAEIWVGTGCDQQDTRLDTCRQVGEVADIYAFDTGRDDIEVRLFDLINGAPDAEDQDCRSTTASTLWVLVDEATDGQYELITSIGVGTTATSMPTNGGVDTTPQIGRAHV